MTWAHLIFFALYVGLGAMMIQSWLKRRSAVEAWRRAAGGAFDRKQKRFVTDLDLDHATLPDDARALLRESRNGFLIALSALMGLLGLQLFLMGL